MRVWTLPYFSTDRQWFNTLGIRAQWDCHLNLLLISSLGNGTWDLEPARPNMEPIQFHLCNPDKKEIRKFVNDLYKNALSRSPDALGLHHWIEGIRINGMTGRSVANDFINSPEMNNKKLSNTNYVKTLYKSLMGRNYDLSGLNFWVNRLNSGYSRQSVLDSFIASTEFNNMCKASKINRG